MADIGIQRAARRAVSRALPISWLGQELMPRAVPDWATIKQLTSVQHKNLVAQLAYAISGWNYTLIGTNNELGMYQITAATLEDYGLLAPGSVASYGTEAVNYRHCWRATLTDAEEYNFTVSSCTDFLNNRIAQDYLAYRIIEDLYSMMIKNTAVLANDSAEVTAGMLAVAWYVGTGTRPTAANINGTGAYAWRYAGVGTADDYYAQGRYSVAVLSR